MEKCFLCEKEIERTFLDKLDGTVVKIKKNDKNEIFFICPECQKKYKNNLKKEIEKK